MAAGPTSADLFEAARQQARLSPARVTLELRLATLEAELAARDDPASDARVPALIRALFPPGTVALDLTKVAQPEGGVGEPAPTIAEQLKAMRGEIGVRVREWRKPLRIGFALRWLLVGLAVAALYGSAPPGPETFHHALPKPPDCQETLSCPPPPGKKDGMWVRPALKVQPGPINWDYVKLALAILAAGGLLWWLLARRQQRLDRQNNPKLGPLLDLSIKLARAKLFAGPRFEQALRALKLRRSQPSGKLDLGRSLRETVRRAGLPTLVYAARRTPPEYLIMSERQAIDDHLPELGRALHARLAEAQILIRHFEFFGAPYRLRADTAADSADYQPLESVLARNDGARALVLSESFDLHDDLADRSWSAALGEQLRPVLLNPREQRHWHEPELELARCGFADVALGDLAGGPVTHALADGDSAKAPAINLASEAADLPEFLADERRMLLSEHAPESLETAALIENLRLWLTPLEMKWLKMLALLPVLHIGFTHFAGIVLFRGEETLSAASLLKLVRLPWFRAGTMPEWFRQALIADFTQSDSEAAKALVRTFFAPETAAVRTVEDILRVHRKATSKVWRRRFKRQLAGSTLPVLSDRLLYSVFAAKNPAEIEIDVPNRQKKRSTDWPQWQAGAFTLAGLLAQLAIMDFFVQDSVPQPPVYVEFEDPKSAVNTPNTNTDPSIQTAPKQDGPSTTSAAAAAATPTLTASPTSTDPVRASRVIYIQIATDRDKAAALTIAGRLGNLELIGGPAILGGVEVRTDSPARTQVRCFSTAGCANVPAIIAALKQAGVSAQKSDYRKSSLASPNHANEVWFADADMADQRPTPAPTPTPPRPTPRPTPTPAPPPTPPPTPSPIPIPERIKQLDTQSDAAYDAGDFTTAFKLNTESCNLGGVRGCFWNGYLYEAGKGVPRSNSQAISWYRRACSLGAAQACDKVKELSGSSGADQPVSPPPM